MTQRILIIGRGPSAYETAFDYDKYDIVIKLKLCNPKQDTSPNSRTDIIVFSDKEVYGNRRRDYDVFKYLQKKTKTPLKTIWYWSPKGVKSPMESDKRFHGLNIQKIDNINDYHKTELGINIDLFIWYTTGLAAILYTVKEFPTAHIDIVGFDNLVHNINVGELDHPTNINGFQATNRVGHDITKEHQIIMHLLQTKKIHLIE
jgi:hypothetical protein